MTAAWKTLHLEDHGVPQLLVKVKLDFSGYTIHLTDFSRVWGETLTKREIVRRAIKEDCSIDPSEGDDQYKILLEKLQQAVNHENGTTISLTSSPKVAEGLLLSLSAPLPSPLPEFEWEIQLSPLPAQHVEAELVRPLLQHAQNLGIQLAQLFRELADKDRVISKITDRLETSGNDLTTVFPGVSNIKISRKKSQREQLARHVKGLGDFDEAAWKAQHAGMNGEGSFDGGQLDGLLGDLPETAAEGAGSGVAGDWWRKVDACTNATINASHRKPAAPKSTESQGAGDLDVAGHADSDEDVTMYEENLDNEFQRQGTPPHVKHVTSSAQSAAPKPTATQSRPTQLATHTIEDDDETEDEDDLDAPVPKAKSSQQSGPSAGTPQRSATPEKFAPRRPGVVGERAHAPMPIKEPSPEAQPAAAIKPTKKLGTIGGKPKASASPEPASEETIASARPRSKLGTIGGKPKSSSTSPEPIPEPLTTEQPSPAKHRKLGMIGGKTTTAEASNSRQASVAASTAPSTREASPARSSRAPERRQPKEPTPPRETSAERADRKRDELKRQLEEKAKGPVKKRRKF